MAPVSELPGKTPPHGGVAHETVQLTPIWLESLAMVAVRFGTVAAAWIDAEAGVMAMVTNGTVILIARDLVESISEVAVIVAVASLAGGVAGAA